MCIVHIEVYYTFDMYNTYYINMYRTYVCTICIVHMCVYYTYNVCTKHTHAADASDGGYVTGT